MALVAASLHNLGTSTTTMSCLASNEGAMYSHTLGFSFKISSVKYMYRFLIMDFSPEMHGMTELSLIDIYQDNICVSSSANEN
jgi:hypothetical protein